MTRAALAAVLAIYAGGCAASSAPKADDPGASGGSDPPGQMAAFVLELIQHHTAEDERPVAYERFASLPDPDDDDANDLDAYASLF